MVYYCTGSFKHGNSSTFYRSAMIYVFPAIAIAMGIAAIILVIALINKK